jgi:hypothetical protein
MPSTSRRRATGACDFGEQAEFFNSAFASGLVSRGVGPGMRYLQQFVIAQRLRPAARSVRAALAVA